MVDSVQSRWFIIVHVSPKLLSKVDEYTENYSLKTHTALPENIMRDPG